MNKDQIESWDCIGDITMPGRDDIGAYSPTGGAMGSYFPTSESIGD